MAEILYKFGDVTLVEIKMGNIQRSIGSMVGIIRDIFSIFFKSEREFSTQILTLKTISAMSDKISLI